MKKGTLKSYVTGFVISVILTLIAYWFVYQHVESGHIDFKHNSLIGILLTLALIQFYVQAVFFLHLGRNKSARWNVVSFLFMIGVVFTIVVGSLWIIANLDYHHGPGPSEQYIIEDEIPQTDHNGDSEAHPATHDNKEESQHTR